MHMQGGQRRSKLAREGKVVHEKIRSAHTYTVVELSVHYVVRKHDQTVRVERLGRSEVLELFERSATATVNWSGA